MSFHLLIDTPVAYLTESAPAVAEPTHTAEWYKEFVKEDDAEVLEHSGKLLLLLEILRMAEELTEKV